MKNRVSGSYIVKPLNEEVSLSCDSCGGVPYKNYFELDKDQMYQVMLDNGPDCFIECKDANTGLEIRNPVKECGASYGELIGNFTKRQNNGFKKNLKTFEESLDSLDYEDEESFETEPEEDLTYFGGEFTEHSDYSFLEPDYKVGNFDMDTVATEDLVTSGDYAFMEEEEGPACSVCGEPAKWYDPELNKYYCDNCQTGDSCEAIADGEEENLQEVRESLLKVMKKFKIKEGSRKKALKMLKTRVITRRPITEAVAKLWDEEDLLDKVNSPEFGKAILQICADQGVSKAALPAAFEMLIDLLGDRPDVEEVLNNWPSDSEDAAEEAVEASEEAAEEETSDEPVEESVEKFPSNLSEMRRTLRRKIAESKLRIKSKRF